MELQLGESDVVAGWTCFFFSLLTWSMDTRGNAIFTNTYNLLVTQSIAFSLFTSRIAITKLDILDNLAELKIGTTYKLNGKPLTRYPASDADLAHVEVEYVTLPGWQSSIANVRTWNDLPANAKTYVKFIQDYLQVPGIYNILIKILSCIIKFGMFS